MWYLILMFSFAKPTPVGDGAVTLTFPNEKACRNAVSTMTVTGTVGEHLAFVCRPVPPEVKK